MQSDTDMRRLACGYVEDLLMYPVMTYEFSDEDTVTKLKEYSIEQVRQSILKCEQLTNEVRQRLYSISIETEMDTNTLILVFEESVRKMKEDLK